MNETERAIFTVAIAAAGLIVGYHFGVRRAAMQAAKANPASGGIGVPGAAPLDHMDWFMAYGSGGWFK